MLYIGRVTDNRDPEKLQRVKVRIWEIHGFSLDLMSKEALSPDEKARLEEVYRNSIGDGYVQDTHLPWASVLTAGSGHDSGSVSLYPVGSKVMISTVMGSLDTLIVMGGVDRLSSESLFYGKEGTELGKHSFSKGIPETPQETHTANRSKAVIYKTPKGAAIVIEEEDEGERTRLIDRAGQVIEMYTPVKASENEENKSARGVGNVPDGGEVPTSKMKDGKAWVKFYDLAGQTIEMVATKDGEYIKIMDKEGQSILFDPVNKKIVIESKGTIEEKMAGAKTTEIPGDWNITVGGNVNMDVTGNCNIITGGTCNFN